MLTHNFLSWIVLVDQAREFDVETRTTELERFPSGPKAVNLELRVGDNVVLRQ